jgi:hypothetical protein
MKPNGAEGDTEAKRVCKEDYLKEALDKLNGPHKANKKSNAKSLKALKSRQNPYADYESELSKVF